MGKTPAELEAENLAKQEAEAEVKATAEAEAKKTEEDNLGNKPDFYKTKLEETEKLLKEKDEIISHKNRAIDAEKERRRIAEEKGEPIDRETLKAELLAEAIEAIKGSLPDKEQILEEAKALIGEKDVEAEIKKYAKDNPEANKLIRHYFNALKDSPLHPTTAEKVRDAALMANREFLLTQAKSEGANEERENLMAQFTGSKSSSSRDAGEGNEILDAMVKYAPERVAKARKYL